MREATELARVDEPMRLAASARTARPGELLVLDDRGREVSPWGRAYLQFRLGLLLGTALVVPMLLIAAMGLPIELAAVGLVGLAGAGLGLTRRAMRPYFQAHSRVTAGDLAGAEAILAGLTTPARGERARLRMWLEGWIAYARGQDRRAIDIFERGLGMLRRRDFRRAILQIALVELYARSGAVARARALRGEITATPQGSELMELSLAGADLVLAIAEGTERAFAEETIDRWVRLALEINNTNLTLAALARVVAARGDHELADHLAREARSRFCWCPLECMPALARWVDERIARSETAGPERARAGEDRTGDA